MKRVLAGLLGSLFLVAAAAEATPVTVAEGKTVIFSFDFTAAGSVPPPPYPDMRVQTGIVWSSFDVGDVCRYTFYGDVGGHDPGTSIGACGIDTFESALEESGWLDGLLSIGLTMISGSLTLDPSAVAYDQFGINGQPLTGAIDSTPRVVAEPASLLLLALGLLPLLMTLMQRRAAGARTGASASPTPRHQMVDQNR